MDKYSEEFEKLNEKIDRLLENSNQSQEANLLPEKWLDIQEACMALKVSKRTLQNYRDYGRLPFTKIDGKIYFKAIDIQQMLEKNYIKR